jgi:hypothetical protein
VDVTFTARLQKGVTLQGGTSTGRTALNYCAVTQKLPELLFGADLVGDANANVWLPASNCDQSGNFLTQVKLIGTYTIPRIDVQVASTFQSLPGPQVVANYTATNAIVSPSLGRNLSGGAANMVVDLVEPGTMYGERLNQLDVRVTKIIKYNRVRTSLGVDLYNLLNANPVLTESKAFGTFRRPQKILGARFVELVLKTDF